MKKIVTFLLLFVSFQSLFAQMNFANADSVANYLKGNWTFHRRCGGFAGTCMTPAQLGYTYDLNFTKHPSSVDSVKFQLYKNSSLHKTGSAKIDSVNNVWFLNKVDGLTNGPVHLAFTQVDTLRLNETCADCYGFHFSKNKTVGLQEENIVSAPLFIYPSPAKDQIWVSVKNVSTIHNLLIYNNEGKVVKVFKEGSYACDVSELPAGLYFVSGRTKSLYLRGKFIKN